MALTILKIEMPKGSDWGLLQINNFTNTHFRFEIIEGKPILDGRFFVDNKEPYLRNHDMKKDDDFYLSIQRALEEHVAGLNLMDTKKELAFVTEKRDILNNMLEQVALMESFISKCDQEGLDKIKRDFYHRLEQLDFVEKRL